MERKRNRDSPEPGPSSRVKSDTMDDKKVKRKRMEEELIQSDSTIQESEDASVIDGDLQNQYELGSDWRQLPEMIQEICKHLPCEDIKSVRLVCKVWSEAGAVPLSYKSIYSFKRDYRTSFFKARSYLKRLGNDELTPGFGLRNLNLDWFMEKPTYGGTRPEPRLEDWLEFFRSEHVRDVVWLKLSNFPYRVLDEILLVQPFFPKLKSLELHAVRYLAPVVIPAEAFKGSCSNLELKSVEIYDWIPDEHGWDFFKNCPKLTELKIKAKERHDSARHANDDTRYRRHIEKLTNALAGKQLTSLVLEYESATIYSNGNLVKNHKLDAWSNFCNQLILCNPRLERLHLASFGNLRVSPSAWLTEIPVSTKNLKTFVCTFEIYSVFDVAHLTYLAALLKTFESKSYLKVENFHLSALPPYNWVDRGKFHLSCVKSKLSMISNIWPKYDVRFPKDLLDTLYRLFPQVNYVCSPRQNKTSKLAPLTTALLETLGRDGVFDLRKIAENWDTLKPGRHDSHYRQDLFKFCRLDLRDPEVLNSNLVSSGLVDWKLSASAELISRVSSGDAFYLFDTIPNMSEGWAKVQNATPYWSSVPDDFVPAVVNDERAPAYSFCRMFRVIKELLEPEPIMTRSRARRVE